MSKSLSPSVRRQIIDFDPAAPGAPSVSKFCKTLRISRPSFYKIRDRFLAEGSKALNARSRAPKTPHRVYTHDTAKIVVAIRKRLAGKGWDAGPKSVWHAGVDDGAFVERAPSVSTIARILADAGVVDANPRKRPRKSFLRFQRASAMELWQIDGLEYKLFDQNRTKVTVYQLVDDSTRFDVGTCAYARPENGGDAGAVVAAAVDAYGVPRELLSDNGVAFNHSRRGGVSALERFLADRGCLAIAGKTSSPTTQGKNERSHQTLRRFLDAHTPATLGQVNQLIIEYREYYNHRRHHQALPLEMTPAQAWDAAEHRPSDGVPISHVELEARARKYRDQYQAETAADSPQTATHRMRAASTVVGPQHTATGQLPNVPDEVVINRQNPQIYLHGRIVKVPTYLVGSYTLVISDTHYMLFDPATGEEAIGFPLPMETKASKRLLPLWQVKGARIRDPKPAWTAKHQAYEAEHYPKS